MTENSRGLSIYLLFAGLIIVWGLSWPVIKIGLLTFSPLWMNVIRLALATIALFVICLCTRTIKIPRKADWPMLLIIGIFQIGLFLLLITTGLQYVSAGHGAILAYTTPLWVTPVAVWFGKEALTRSKLIGLILGFAGMLLLVRPWELDWHYSTLLLGNILLLSAALSWAIAMLYTRYATWHSTPLQLIPWQMLIALVPFALYTMYAEPFPQQWDWSGVLATCFLGLLSTGFGFWAMVHIGRLLPVISTALWLLMVPVVGVISAQLLIHEHPSLNLIIAGTFILIGLAFMSLGQWHQQKYRTQVKPSYQCEVEVKLAITTEKIAGLLAHPMVQQHAQGTLVTRQLTSIYYDTPDFDLQRYGVSLRVRYDGEQYVQCLKKKTTRKQELHCRDEWEATIQQSKPDFKAIPDPELRSLLLTGPLGDKVQPVFTTDFTRRSQDLYFADGTHAELVIDQGVVAVADLSEPLSEIEIELQSGSEATLLNVAQQLMADLGLAIGGNSKASRGYALRQKLNQS